MEDKNYIYKKLSDGRYIKEIDNKIEHLATAEEDAKLATDIRSLLQGPQGESGTSGTSGESGTSGINGAKGDMGRTGLTGPRGLNGTSGSSGSSGQDGTSGINGQDGTSGINGRKGDKGDKGDRGFPGLQGPAGQNGSAGVSGTSGTSAPGITSGTSGTSGQNGTSGTSGQNGLSSSLFRYNAKTNSYSPPITSRDIEWNNATQTSSTQIYISHITQDNNDVEVILGGVSVGSVLIIQDRNVSENYQRWTVTNVSVTTASYVTFDVSYIDGGYSFTNGHDIITIVQAVGPSGSSGSSGVNGSSGSAGSSGTSGTSAPFTAISSAPGVSTPLVQNVYMVSSVITIPANTFTAPNSFKLTTYFNHTGTLNNFQQTLYVTATFSAAGTTFSTAPAGATVLALGLNGGSRISTVDRFVHIYTASGSGDGTKVYPVNVASILDTGGSSTQISTLAINWTQTQYILLTSRNTSAGPSLTARCEYFTLASYRN